MCNNSMENAEKSTSKTCVLHRVISIFIDAHKLSKISHRILIHFIGKYKNGKSIYMKKVMCKSEDSENITMIRSFPWYNTHIITMALARCTNEIRDIIVQ